MIREGVAEGETTFEPVDWSEADISTGALSESLAARGVRTISKKFAMLRSQISDVRGEGTIGHNYVCFSDS